MIVVYFLWLYFICDYCMAPRERHCPKHGKGFGTKQSLLANYDPRCKSAVGSSCNDGCSLISLALICS